MTGRGKVRYKKMRIGILAAMGKEIQLLKPLIEELKEVDFKGRTLWVGKIGHNEVCLMQCGIGKVNSALNTQRLIEYFNPDLVLNSGVAGGADGSMHVADMLIATGAAYHDVWCGPDTVYGAADGFTAILPCNEKVVDVARKTLGDSKIRYGLICSGDKFISKAEEVAEIKSHFPDALACDMESASISQVCTEAGIPVNIIRVVSDTPGEAENISQYENFWTEAPQRTFSAIGTLLSALD